MAARSRGLGISSKDMEASRLVFVFVRDSKPRRKVAIPVPDSYTWEQFTDQVKAKLKLSGIADIYLSSNGHKVRSVGELQDIDELCVVEGPDATATNGTSAFASTAAQRGADGHLDGGGGQDPASAVTSPLRQQSLAQERHRVVVSADGLLPSTSASYASDEQAHKYARRAHPVRRTLQRLFPGVFAPGLPVTVRDADSVDGGSSRLGGARRRRARRSGLSGRDLLLVLATLSCVFGMFWIFVRLSSTPPGTTSGRPGGGGGAGGGSASAVGTLDSAAAAAAAAAGAAVKQAAAPAKAAAPQQAAAGGGGAAATAPEAAGGAKPGDGGAAAAGARAASGAAAAPGGGAAPAGGGSSGGGGSASGGGGGGAVAAAPGAKAPVP